MTESKVDQLAAKFGQVKDPGERQGIFSLLATRIADGIEAKEAILTKGTSTEAWNWASGLLSQACQENPQRGFDECLMLATLPRKKGRQGRINEWLRGIGMTMLSLEQQDQYVPKLEDYFSNQKQSKRLVRIIKEEMKRDISHITTKEEANSPEGFNSLEAIYLGLGFANSSQPTAKKLYQLACQEYPKNKPQLELYLKEFPEVDFLANRSPK